MKKVLFAISFLFFHFTSYTQTGIVRDPQIEQMVKEVSTDSLKSYITKTDLPFSKDNYFLGVQSVSIDGNESLPVVPSSTVR